MACKYLPLAQPDPEESFGGNHDLMFEENTKACTLALSFLPSPLPPETF